jgi:glucosylceramidase
MNYQIKLKTLIVIILAIFSISLFAQTEGKKVKIFASSADQKEMLVEQQQDVIFKQDYETENLLINIYPEFCYQRVLGFGAAFTETSAYNFSLLSPESQQQLAELYFGKSGIGYNFCRTHINACDFSIDEYTYVEDGDVDLKTFNIDRDKKYIIPMIKAARKVNPELLLFASPWSPPAWMKDNKRVVRGGRLLPEFYPTWAKYFSLYLREFKKEGIDFFGVTIQNEPKAVQGWESCIWTGKEEGIFATNFLRPSLDEYGFGEIKIIIWDHNKERIMERARESMTAVPGAEKAIWGVGHHLYSGDHFDNLRMTHELYPDKTLIATENNAYGVRGGDVAANWRDIERYAKETIMNFNNFTAAAVAWNMIVDFKTGGPYHNTNAGSSSAPVWVDADKKEFILGPTYYADGHFSKFIKRGAVRIGSSVYDDAVKAAAFCNPDGEIIVVVLNTSERNATPKIRLNNCTADFTMPAKSLQTLIIPTAQ